MLKYNYKILKNKKLKINKYFLKSIDENSIEKIRKWRNKQINILRQKNQLSTEDQKIYFQDKIKKEINKKQPKQIILLFCYKKVILGYGGITNISWLAKRGELSFLLDNKYANKKIDSEYYFPIFLKLIKELAFNVLKLNIIWSETYSIRPNYIRQLELNSFVNVGIIKNNREINNQIYDTYYHEIINQKFKKTKKNNFFFNSIYGNILITSSSKKIPLMNEIYKSIKVIDQNIKLIAGDYNNNVLSKHFADQFCKMPITKETNFKQILNILIKFNIKVVIPTRDSELVFWSKNKSKFEKKGVKILINNLQKIITCNDKLKFYKTLKSKNIKTPRLFYKNAKNLKKLIIKERYDSSSLIQKNISKNKIQILSKKFKDPFIQEFIKGEEISVDVWSSKYNKKNYFISRTRNLIIDGESKITKGFDDKKLNNIVERIISKLKLEGPYMFQFIFDKKNYYLIDCNPRIGGASTYSMNNGLEMILWSLIEIYKLEKKFHIKFNKRLKLNTLVRIPFDKFQ